MTDKTQTMKEQGNNEAIPYGPISLGDYLDFKASVKEVSRSELEDSIENLCEIEGIDCGLIFSPRSGAQKDFEKQLEGYDTAVNVKRIAYNSLFGLISYYEIHGTAVKFKDKK